jgi:hypothetical protein
MREAKSQIENRIARLEPGSVFTPKDFLNLGPRGSVDVVLSKMTAEGKIRRLSRGLYEVPKHSDFLGGPVSPDSDQIAQTIARRYRWRIIPDGSLAANMLGLSTQVRPAFRICPMDRPGKSRLVV